MLAAEAAPTVAEPAPQAAAAAVLEEEASDGGPREEANADARRAAAKAQQRRQIQGIQSRRAVLNTSVKVRLTSGSRRRGPTQPVRKIQTYAG